MKLTAIKFSTQNLAEKSLLGFADALLINRMYEKISIYIDQIVRLNVNIKAPPCGGASSSNFGPCC